MNKIKNKQINHEKESIADLVIELPYKDKLHNLFQMSVEKKNENIRACRLLFVIQMQSNQI